MERVSCGQPRLPSQESAVPALSNVGGSPKDTIAPIFRDPYKRHVKQGGVLSPVLFCVYLDELLLALSAAKVGCYVGSVFVGALAYANDLVLIAPSATALQKM